MLAAYNIRRSSVVLNPRGRVLGGLGEGEGESGGYGGNDYGGSSYGAEGSQAGSSDPGPGGGYDYGGSSYGTTVADQAAASAAEAAFSQQQTDYEAVSLAAANAATFAAAQMADEAAMAAAAKALASNSAAKQAAQKALTIASMFPGPVGMIVGIAKAIASLVDGVPKSQAEIDQTFENARGGAQGNVEVLKQISILKTNSDAASKAGSEAAVARLYQTYANRNPNSVELAYWSNAFGPTITADEVLQFQQFLYANEPNLRPVAMTTTTTSTSPGAGLALPIIAAIAGYFILGS